MEKVKKVSGNMFKLAKEYANKCYVYVMKKFFVNALVLVAALIAIPALMRAYNDVIPAPKLNIIAEDMVKIEGSITNLELESEKINRLVRSGKNEIFIVINSGGGLVAEGVKFIERMHDAQHMGVRIRCVVDGLAASMATVIYSECDDRYSLFGSRIMWHSAARGYIGRINQQKGSKIVEALKLVNDELWVSTRIYFWPWYFAEHYEKETLISVSNIEKNSFGYLKVIKNMLMTMEDGSVVKVKK